MENIKAFTPITKSDDLIRDAKENFDLCIQWANYWKKVMDVALDAPSVSGSAAIQTNIFVKEHLEIVQVHKARGKQGVFEPLIMEILVDGIPRTTRMLMMEAQRRTGRTYDRRDFASRLANIAKDKKTIKNQHFPQAENENKYWWGKSDWFDQHDHMKSEYINKSSILKAINAKIPEFSGI